MPDSSLYFSSVAVCFCVKPIKKLQGCLNGFKGSEQCVSRLIQVNFNDVSTVYCVMACDDLLGQQDYFLLTKPTLKMDYL